MSDPLLIDLFAEDRGHEELLRALISRLAREAEREIDLRVRSAQGGHGKVIQELKLYQRLMERGIGGAKPNLLVVVIDANCETHAARRNAIRGVLDDPLRDLFIAACPEPHVERWYLADLQTFHQVIGVTPTVPQDKCERDYYKHILAAAIRDAGHPAMLGGIEFASDLAAEMDLYRAGKADSSLKHFVDELSGRLRLAQPPGPR